VTKGYIVIADQSIFSAAVNSIHSFQIREESCSLEVQGIIWDTVTSLGSSKYLIGQGDTSHSPLNVETVIACLFEASEMLRGTKVSLYQSKAHEVIRRLSTHDIQNAESIKAPKKYRLA
jgi:hypothetical protein